LYTKALRQHQIGQWQKERKYSERKRQYSKQET